MTLIENVYIIQILNGIRLCVILSDMSDHYPCIASVNLGNKIPTKEMRQFSTRKLTDDAIQGIKTDFLMTDWTDLNQLTSNMASQIL